MDRDYKREIEIDRSNLTQSIMEQAGLYMDWGEFWADAIAARDSQMEQYDVVVATVDAEVRTNPKKFGWLSDKPPTEAFIKQCIILDKRVRESSAVVIRKSRDVNVFAVAKEAFAHRKSALEMLVRRECSGLNAEPKEPGTKAIMEAGLRQDHSNALGSEMQKRRIKR